MDGCDGSGTEFTGVFECLADARAGALVEDCDPMTCTADARSEARIEDCNGAEALFGCSATAIGDARAVYNSSASAFNLALADGEGGAAVARAIGDALATSSSFASVYNVATATGQGATATARGGCEATLLSHCEESNTAIADGNGSTALSVGGGSADNGSTASQYGFGRGSRRRAKHYQLWSHGHERWRGLRARHQLSPG